MQLKGLLQEEEKYQLPPGFLMEVLDINEQLVNTKNDPDFKLKIQATLDKLQIEIYEPVKMIVENYQEVVISEKDLLQVKEYYYKKKYLQRINQQLNRMS